MTRSDAKVMPPPSAGSCALSCGPCPGRVALRHRFRSAARAVRGHNDLAVAAPLPVLALPCGHQRRPEVAHALDIVSIILLVITQILIRHRVGL